MHRYATNTGHPSLIDKTTENLTYMFIDVIDRGD